jgi:carbonic anhydrase
MQKLIEGLHKFRSEVFHSKQDLFHRLAKGQHPEALFITCSDSRISPGLITQSGPGDLFVLRNVGNIIPAYSEGSSEAAAIEFAVANLGVKDIIVCGHTLCGAMRALLDPKLVEKVPAVQAWLRNAEPTRRLIAENYSHIEGDELLSVTVEENVIAQIDCLRAHPIVRSRLMRKELSLHGWVYKIETGDIFQYDGETGQFLDINDSAQSSRAPAALKLSEAS